MSDSDARARFAALPTMAVGLVFVVSGFFKVISLDNDALRRTLVWKWSGANPWIVLALALAEVALGMFLVLSIARRRIAVVAIGTLVLFTIAILASNDPQASQPCGCFGGLDYRASIDSPLRALSRNLIFIAALSLSFLPNKSRTA